MRNVANVKKQGFQLFGGLLLMVMKRLFSELSSITLSSDSAERSRGNLFALHNNTAESQVQLYYSIEVQSLEH